MKQETLFRRGHYSLDWVKDFDQGCLWWGGSEADEASWYELRAGAIDRRCGPGTKRILDLGRS